MVPPAASVLDQSDPALDPDQPETPGHSRCPAPAHQIPDVRAAIRPSVPPGPGPIDPGRCPAPIWLLRWPRQISARCSVRVRVLLCSAGLSMRGLTCFVQLPTSSEKMSLSFVVPYVGPVSHMRRLSVLGASTCDDVPSGLFNGMQWSLFHDSSRGFHVAVPLCRLLSRLPTTVVSALRRLV